MMNHSQTEAWDLKDVNFLCAGSTTGIERWDDWHRGCISEHTGDQPPHSYMHRSALVELQPPPASQFSRVSRFLSIRSGCSVPSPFFSRNTFCLDLLS